MCCFRLRTLLASATLLSLSSLHRVSSLPVRSLSCWLSDILAAHLRGEPNLARRIHGRPQAHEGVGRLMGLFVDALLLKSLLLILDLPLNLSYASFNLSHKGEVSGEVGKIFGLAVRSHCFFEVLDIFKLYSKVVVRYAQGLVQ